jgi:hypothetical protein
MNTPTIQMPREVAREQLKHYRKQLHKRADAEYSAVAQGLEALAEGTPLINLAECFRTVPLDEKYRPRLAVSRADRPRVWLSRYHDTAEFTSKERWTRGRAGHNMTFRFSVPPLPAGQMGMANGSNLVPMVPAPVREQVGAIDLSKHLILWEVEKWDDIPRDPYLLRHCGGELYAVIAEWDLTDLERAVMAGRLR